MSEKIKDNSLESAENGALDSADNSGAPDANSHTPDGLTMKIIARVRTDFTQKFGIPRQSRLADKIEGTVIFEPEFRNDEALRGLDGFSHIWLIWQFSENVRAGFSPTVRPPRLGGNKRMGVFATRSPFRPNPIGLSCVKLLSIEYGTKDGTVLHIAGADLLDGTPIFDIKPYVAYSDCVENASEGFAADVKDYILKVDIPQLLAEKLPAGKLEALTQALSGDPRPSYQDDDRIYSMEFAGCDISFKVRGGTLTVTDIRNLENTIDNI